MIQEKERRSSESLLVSQFPLTLKKQLVDDWENVTQLGKVFNTSPLVSLFYCL
jgi:mortality factor 4-like protein 1